MSLGLFAFAKGVADEHEDIYNTGIKRRAVEAKAQMEEDQEHAASSYQIMVTDPETGRRKAVHTFNTRRKDSSDAERIASGRTLSREIATMHEEMFTIVDNKDGIYSPEQVSIAQGTLDFFQNPEISNQIDSFMSMAVHDITKPREIGADDYAYEDFNISLPHAQYFPNLYKQLGEVTSAGYVHNTDNDFLWNNYLNTTGRGNAAKTENNNGGELSVDAARRTFQADFNTWIKGGKDLSPKVGIYDKVIQSFLESDLPNNLDVLLSLVEGVYPRKLVTTDKFPGHILGESINQVKDADIDKKAAIIIGTNEAIARLTLDMQQIMVGLHKNSLDENYATGNSEIDSLVTGALPRWIIKFTDTVIGPTGAFSNLPAFTDVIQQKLGNDLIGGKKFLWKNEEYTFDEFMKVGIEKEAYNLIDITAVGKDGKFTGAKDQKFEVWLAKNDNKMTVEQALNISEGSKNPGTYNAWKDTIGYAGLFAAKEIALAFNVAIMRQGFEGGKAVSDPDFERSFDEIRAGGGILGLERPGDRIKYFSSLRNEMAEKALGPVIFNKAKIGVGGRDYKHAASNMMTDVSNIIFSANTQKLYDEKGEEIPMPPVGRQIPLALTINPTLMKELMTFEDGPYAQWLTDNSGGAAQDYVFDPLAKFIPATTTLSGKEPIPNEVLENVLKKAAIDAGLIDKGAQVN